MLGTTDVFGLKIVCSPYLPQIPKLKIRTDFVWCTEETRRSINDWLMVKFAIENVSYVFQYGRDERIIVDPKTMAVIKGLG